uniref:MLV-related proviral Env polyprotein-like n=1 Tax=Peromyscus maniculatus bairdii TaxID=230844 RepID=A0A8C9CTT0_PERMB
MESSTLSETTKDKTHLGVPLIPLIVLLLTLGGASPESPHMVKKITWQVISQTGDVVWSTTAQHAPNTWWPDLTPKICDLVARLDTWDIPEYTHTNRPSTGVTAQGQQIADSPGCRTRSAYKKLQQTQLYVCPRDGRDWDTTYKCGGLESFFCAKWGCETTGDAYWGPSSSWDLIKVGRSQKGEDSLNISFTPKSMKFSSWTDGRSWGVRFYMTGTDRGFTFQVKQKIESVNIPVGPNPVLPEQKLPSQPERAPAQLPHRSITLSPTASTATTASFVRPGTGDRLLKLIQGAYLTLNLTAPNKTRSCWLCLISSPPYYEGVAVMGNFTNQTSPFTRCHTAPRHKLTLSEVSGQGLCLGTIPTSHQGLCNSTQALPSGAYYLAAPKGTFWACNTGLTPCVSTTVLNLTSDYCILIELWPKVTYHEPEYIYSHFEMKNTRFKREPVSLTLALLLGGITMGGIAAGVGTGTAALMETGQFRQLQVAMNTDIKALEESVSALEKSLTSLSEVVLQNRRGLDILFLQEGNLCAALKEECCFYADHTGVVRDNMAKLRERLKQRQQLFESHQGWFERWFKRSPWFTTLVSTIMGPLIILLLVLLFRPCILNRLVQFIKDRVSVVQALILTQQYQRLRQTIGYCNSFFI